MMRPKAFLVSMLMFSSPLAAATDAWIIRGAANANAPFCGNRAAFTADAVFYNTTALPAHVEVLDISNGGTPAAPAAFDIPSGDVIDFGEKSVETYPPAALWLTHVSVPDGVVIDGFLVWHFIDACKGVSPYPYYLGRVTLPVFRSLTPPGAVAVHPGTDLGAEDVRMNVGIYNGGDVNANAVVHVYRPSCGPDPIVTRFIRIDPRSATQVSIGAIKQCDLARPFAYVTALLDQPSLSWVTSLSNDSVPTVTIGSSRQ